LQGINGQGSRAPGLIEWVLKQVPLFENGIEFLFHLGLLCKFGQYYSNFQKMKTLKRWLPSFLLMAIIFGLSSTPSKEMPNFGLLDYLVKKGGHMFGYALLAVANLRGLSGKRPWLAWMLTVAFAASDEYHQSFVAGRHAALSDVLLFDNFGSLLGLWAAHLFQKRNQKSDASAPPEN
jgi:VanZ family protein